MSAREQQEAEAICERLEELDLMLHALQQASETMELFLKPLPPPELERQAS